MAEIRVLNKFINFFTEGHTRTLKAKKNISIAFITSGLSMVISFLVVPLTLSYVDTARYGIWMAISVIINWFAFFDIGLGNGLRVKLAEALALNKYETAKTYVSSAFAMIFGIAFIMFLIFFIVANFINWNTALNTELVSNNELLLIVVIVFFFFCIGFVLKIVSSILQAMQKYGLNNLIQLAASLLGLIAIYILVHTTEGSLFRLCLVYGSKYSIVMLFASIILFNSLLKDMRPSIKYVNLKKAMPLTKLGLKFFINQILYLVVFHSISILVIQFYGPEDVTVINLAKRYITLSSMLYIMVLTPFLSAFTEAFTIKDFKWIKNIMKKLHLTWLLSSIVTFLMIIFSGMFFNIWIGDKVNIPLILVVFLGISAIIHTWMATHTLFLNGIGKIKLQLYFLGIEAVLYIPLSYLFYKIGMGLLSVILPQIIFSVFGALIFTEQYKKIINQKALGIWGA